MCDLSLLTLIYITFIFVVLQFFYNKSQHLIKYQDLSYFYNLRNYFFISPRYHLLLILILLLLYFYLFFLFETLLDKCCLYLSLPLISQCFNTFNPFFVFAFFCVQSTGREDSFLYRAQDILKDAINRYK